MLQMLEKSPVSLKHNIIEYDFRVFNRIQRELKKGKNLPWVMMVQWVKRSYFKHFWNCTKCTMYTMYKMYNVQCTKCTMYKMYNVQNVQCTKCTRYKMYNVQNVQCTKCTLYNVQNTCFLYFLDYLVSCRISGAQELEVKNVRKRVKNVTPPSLRLVYTPPLTPWNYSTQRHVRKKLQCVHGASVNGVY